MLSSVRMIYVFGTDLVLYIFCVFRQFRGSFRHIFHTLKAELALKEERQVEVSETCCVSAFRWSIKVALFGVI